MFDPGRTGPEKGTQMDASVNMKMSPAEHRLIRSAVEEAMGNAIEAGSVPLSDRKGMDPQIFRDARERATQLSDLLTKL